MRKRNRERNRQRVAHQIIIHSKHIALDAIQEELRLNPWRLEEKKVKYNDTHFDSHVGNTPLMSSVRFENVAVVEYLLSIGANSEAKNEV